jgi:NodT family efflux transporter outer membrane factor (OMF) lipoprotein
MRAPQLSAVGVMLTLAACAVGPDFKRPTPPADAGYGSAPLQGETAATAGPGGSAQRYVADMDIPQRWWMLFQSPSLDQLVKQALDDNPNITAAQAALRQANELYLAQRATFIPSVQGSFDASRAKNAIGTIANPTSLPQVNPYYNLYTAQLSVSYMPDVFGSNRRATESAKAQADSARYQLEATRLTLTSNLVVTAIAEASLRNQIKSTERLIELQRQLTATVRGQQGFGTASKLDLLAQEAAEDQAIAALPALHKQLAQSRDALTALLGRLPSQEPTEVFHLEELTLPAELPVSLPSKLVAQRPDIRVAEENLHAASAQAGIALANMLPQFTITADTGSTALAIGKLFSPYTGFWDIGASLTQTLFDAGVLLHKKRAAYAALDQAAAQYRAAVILGCQNVADSLHALQEDAEALRADSEADRAAKSLFDIARQQRALGTISAVALLNVEQTYLQAELTLAQAQANRFSDTAALFQALGGGWLSDSGGGTT